MLVLFVNEEPDFEPDENQLIDDQHGGSEGSSEDAEEDLDDETGLEDRP
jgi:hypothetical protein